MRNLFSQKAVKVVLVLITAAVLLLALSSAVLATADDPVMASIQKYTDMPENHWAYLNVVRLTSDGAITGYTDGTFKPSNNITRAEFLALVVRAILQIPEVPPAGQHWATNIVKTAEKNSIVENREFAADTWNNPINRQEMAKIMARAMQYVLKEAQAERTSIYTSKVTDYNSIPESYRSYVAQVYAKGIVTGYPDGSFGGGRQATRAEAATMIVRLIDPIYRIATAPGTDVPVSSGITFNPSTDVAADGRMRLAKAEEYLMKNLQSLRFFEEGGKFYFEGNVAEVPEGFRNRLYISFEFKKSTGLPVATYTTLMSFLFHKGVTELPKVGPFKEEIEGINSSEQINYVLITMAIEAINHTNKNKDGKSYEVYWSIYSTNDNRIAAVDCITYEKQTEKFYDLSKVFTW